MKRMTVLLVAAMATCILAQAAERTSTVPQCDGAFESSSESTGQFFNWNCPLFIDGSKPEPQSFIADYGWAWKPPAGPDARVPGYDDLNETFAGTTTSNTFAYPPASAYPGGELTRFCIEITTVYSARDTSKSPWLCMEVDVPDDDGTTTSHTFPYPPESTYGGGALSHLCIQITTVYGARDTSEALLVCPEVSVPADA